MLTGQAPGDAQCGRDCPGHESQETEMAEALVTGQQKAGNVPTVSADAAEELFEGAYPELAGWEPAWPTGAGTATS